MKIDFNTLRPCYWQSHNKDGRKFKALFHQLITIQRPVPGGLTIGSAPGVQLSTVYPAIELENGTIMVPRGFTIGSAPGGQLSTVYAAIELENGTIRYVDPYEITFIDNQFSGYCWPDDYEKESKK